MSSTEPFPTLSAHQYITSNRSTPPKPNANSQPRRRRTSSNNLPSDPHGDTGAPALATRVITKQEGLEEAAADKRHATDKVLRPHSKRRKARSFIRRYKRFSLRHTWFNPLLLCLAAVTFYLRNPTPSNPIHPALFLSYPIPSTSPDAPTQYGKGGHDFTFVAFYTIFFSFTREFIMQRFLRPLANYYGIRGRGKQSRFMEQAYTAIYFFFFGPFGLYIMSRSPIWYFNTRSMYEGFPHRQHEGLFKAYYLLQAAYWTQQALVIVLLLEKPRKDFKELVLHHIVTIALIWCSYRFHFTYMGLAVYVTHDISDFFLATSKVLHYISSPITSYYFAMFALIWGYLRHYLNLRILYSVLTEFRTVGPFVLDWETQQYKCWISQYITFALLLVLQGVNLFWYFLILRIAKRALFDNVQEDTRSVDEDEEAEEVEGSTEEKRRSFGIEGAKAGDSVAQLQGQRNGNGRVAPPTVLVNGVPVEKVPVGRVGVGTARSVEISSSTVERRTKRRA